VVPQTLVEEEARLQQYRRPIGNGGQSEMSGVRIKGVEDRVGAYPTFGRVDKDFIRVVHLEL
jgi:hypothetical protein